MPQRLAKPRQRLARTALIGGLLLGALAGVAPAQAAVKVSYLQVNSVTPPDGWNSTTKTLTMDISGSPMPNSVVVDLSLDNQCPNALDVDPNKQGYLLLLPATNAVTATITSSPTVNGTFYKCDDHVTVKLDAKTATDADGITYTFTPMGKNGGQSKKLGNLSITVIVRDDGGTVVGCEPNCPTSDVPAAPAVANMYLQGKSLNGADAPNLNTCKANNGGKNNWKGVLIGKVTDWMPKPESVKNSDPDWVGKVQDAVDAFCTNTTPTPYA